MKVEGIIADLRVLRGDPEVVSVHINVAHALADEVERLRAIIEGRTTPPTDMEALDILERGGSFRVVCNSESYECSTLSSVWAAADLPNAVWWAHNVYGRPCAWPGDVP